MTESGYGRTRKFIDENVPDWTRGDDGPIYWAIKLHAELRAFLEPPKPASDYDHCVRCGAAYAPGGQCSRWMQGCQGGRGENPHPTPPASSPTVHPEADPRKACVVEEPAECGCAARKALKEILQRGYWREWMAIARAALATPCDCHGLREEHDAIIENLSKALFPDSLPDCARGEFVLDGMGACQVIERLRAELAAMKENYSGALSNCAASAETITRLSAVIDRGRADELPLREQLAAARSTISADRRQYEVRLAAMQADRDQWKAVAGRLEEEKARMQAQVETSERKAARRLGYITGCQQIMGTHDPLDRATSSLMDRVDIAERKLAAALEREREAVDVLRRVYANPCNWRRSRENGPIDLWESTHLAEWDGPELAAAIGAAFDARKEGQ